MKRIILITLITLIFTFLTAEIIFFDGFEENSSWVLSGEFEIGIPNGLGGEHGNADPLQAYEGNNVLGVDLTGYGDYPGDYEPNLSEDQYYAISPAIDCSQYHNVMLSFQRWLGVEQPAYDHARIEISNDNGASWITVWENSQTISENSWGEEEIDISGFADLQSHVLIAFTIGESDGSWQYCGWNIDNFTISGDRVLTGDIQGYITDDISMQPIANAMISTPYKHTFTNSQGYYLLNEVPVVPMQITVSALGYDTFVSDEFIPIADSTATMDFSLHLSENLPPAPTELSAAVQYNTVSLNWHSPVDSDYYFIAYNLYRNNVLISTITDTFFIDSNLVTGEYIYYVSAYYDVGSSLPSNEVQIEVTSTANNDDEISEQTVIAGNYPNPFSTTAHIFYQLKKSAKIKIDIYNLKGQKITTLVNDDKKQGRYLTQWNGKDKKGKIFPSGIYYYLISANGKKVKTGKLLLLK